MNYYIKYITYKKIAYLSNYKLNSLIEKDLLNEL